MVPNTWESNPILSVTLPIQRVIAHSARQCEALPVPIPRESNPILIAKKPIQRVVARYEAIPNV